MNRRCALFTLVVAAAVTSLVAVEADAQESRGTDADPAARPAGEPATDTPDDASDASEEDRNPGEASAGPFSGPDLGPIRDDLTAIMDDLVQTRSRIAVLGRHLFQTKVRIEVDNDVEGYALARIVVTLDGTPVYRASGAESAGAGRRKAFEGFAAPGPHLLRVEVEQRSRDDDDYRYTLREEFRLEVLRGRLTDILVILDDDSDIAEDFPDDGEGEYDVRTRLRVAARELEGQ